ncbi:universal stress protein [soil metagenome]
MSTSPVLPGSVVVGVDGSPQSELAVSWAAEQAQLEGRALTLVHGTGSTHAWWMDVAAGSADLGGMKEDAALIAGRALLDTTRQTVAAAFPDVEVHTLLQADDARQTLLDLSEAASMLVVGSRGRGVVASLVLGSVSSAVTRHAACPVVVLRPRDPDVTPQGILVGVDRSGRSRAAVEFAYRQASIHALPLTVTHCSFGIVVGPDDVPEIPYDTPGYEQERLLVDAAVNGMSEKFPDVRVTLTLGRGLVDTFLIDAAHASSMVVVGSHADRFLWNYVFNRNVDRSVVMHAPAVVAVVPEPSDHR